MLRFLRTDSNAPLWHDESHKTHSKFDGICLWTSFTYKLVGLPIKGRCCIFREAGLIYQTTCQWQ